MNNSFIQTVFEQKQFEHNQLKAWLESIFQIKEKLQLKYDPNLQEYFYVKIYEFITAGKDYLLMVKNTCEQGNSQIPTSYSSQLTLATDILNSFDESELEFIEFRRHSASHIFTNGYNIIQDNLKIKKERMGKNLLEIHSSFDSIFEKHPTLKDFDLHFNTTVFRCLDDVS